MKEAQEANKLQNLSSYGGNSSARRYETSSTFRNKQEMFQARKKTSFLEKGKNPQQGHRKQPHNQFRKR